MLMLYFFGSQLEGLWGTRRFIQFLLACTVAAAVVYRCSRWCSGRSCH